MKSLFIISTEYGGLIFSLTYTISLAIGIGVLIYKGYRKKYNMGSVILITLCGLVFFIIGNKLFTVTPDNWKELLIDQDHSIHSGKTILGGILGLLLGAFIAVRWLKFKQPVLDHLAIVFPVAMAVQRIGCLMGGCCFGKPCDLPWAVQYSKNSDAYYHHLQSGLISFDQSHSLSVHPTQLYQIIGCLIIAFLVYRYRNYWKAKGSLFLFTVLMYGVLRFMTEFFRDPVANGVAGQTFIGLKYVQWSILIALLVIAFLMVIREKHYIRRVVGNIDRKINWRHYSLFIIVLFLLSTQWGWFEYKEKLMIMSVSVPLLLFLLWKAYYSYTMPAIRWGFPFIILGGFVFMGQTVITDDKTDPPSYAEFSVGASFGRFYNEVREYMGQAYSHTETRDGFCGPYQYDVYVPVYDYHDRRHTFMTYGFGAKYVFRFGQFKKLHLGATYFWSREYETDSQSGFSKYYISRGFCPMIKMEWRWVGVGLGVNLGNLRYAKNNNGHDGWGGTFDQLIYDNYDAMPSVHLRVGPYDTFFAEYNYANSFPGSSPAPLHKGGLGSGLGMTNGTKVVMGVSDLGVYAEADVVIKDKYVVSLMCNGNFQSGVENQRMVSMGFKYRIYGKR